MRRMRRRSQALPVRIVALASVPGTGDRPWRLDARGGEARQLTGVEEGDGGAGGAKGRDRGIMARRSAVPVPRMMPMPTRLRPVLLIALLSLVLPRPATAQTPTAPAPFAVANLDGIQRAGMRAYGFDVGDLAEAIATPGSSNAAPTGLVFLYGVVAEFGAPEQAATAMEAIARELADELTNEGDGGLRFTLRAAAVPALGDRATRITGTGAGTPTAAGAPATIGGYVVQQGPWVYVALAAGTGNAAADADEAARGLVDFALGHDAGADAGQYQAGGTSEGGLWEKLPGSGDQAALQGMTPLVDSILAPDDGGNG